MDVWLVTIGADATRHELAQGALEVAGASVSGAWLATDPSRVELESVLDRAAGRRVVIQSAAADLARVLRRLMRRDELSRLETAVLPLKPVPFLTQVGVPSDLVAAAVVAVSSATQVAGVLKDDSGNLVVDRAVLRPWTTKRLWVRAYVDDDCLCDGQVRGLVVSRGASGGLTATVSARWGSKTLSGRGLSLACDDAAISSDGAARDQPRRKRIWWDEPEQWRLAVPSPTGSAPYPMTPELAP